MPDTVLDALRRNLANSDPASQADKVKRIKARIAKLEKAEAKPEPAAKPAPVPASPTFATPNKGNK